MRAFIVFFMSLWAASFASESCYSDVVKACTPIKVTTINCTAKYGAIQAVQEGLQNYVNHHFIRSFEYLLMSTHFANYEKNRPGFEKLFRDLSDDTWKDAIELIQYITKRGGEMNFNMAPLEIAEEDGAAGYSPELYEFSAIAKALDTHKKLALEAHTLHKEVARKTSNHHDPEISSHLEHEFMHKHRDIIRKLAGYTTDLRTLLDGPDSSLSLYLFDDYLQKQ